MKKFLTAAFAALLCLILAGCTDISVDCGIKANHTAYMKIGLTVDLSGLDDDNAREASNRLRQLIDYYKDTLGFAVQGDGTEWIRSGEPIQLVMTWEKQAESYPAAFEELKAMACDERMSPFTRANLLVHDDEREQGYIAEVTLNADQVWKNTGVENFPKAIREKLEAGFAECSGTLSLTLPATLVEEHTGTLEQADGFATAAVDLSLNDATTLKLSTRALLEEGEIIPGGGELPAERLHQKSRFLQILIPVAACIFAVSLAVLVVSAVRRRKKPPVS